MNHPVKMISKVVYVPLEFDGTLDLRNIDVKRTWAADCCPGQIILKAKIMIPASDIRRARAKLKKQP